jgi:EAL domain-containing protein (putative c-di-GMP-specific phosphodiesterase class I)/DNA-binding response OmpR family regulator
MHANSESLSLLIAGSRKEEAESLVESLRRAGLSVRGISSGTPDRLTELVSKERIELILCCAYDPEVDLEGWMAEYEKLDQDVPFIIIADEATDSSMVLDALHAGARDLTTKGDTEHLRALIARELSELERRPGEDRRPRGLEESEKPCPDLVGAAELAPRIIREARLPMDRHPRENEVPRRDTGSTPIDSATPTPGEPLERLRPNASEPRETRKSDLGGTALDEERRIARRIERALDGDGFELFYQPIVSLKGDRQESYQLLPRLRDEDGTLRAAKEFLGIAERSGAMVAVDRWVLRAAISGLAAQRLRGQEIRFFVNIAEATLEEDKLLVWICDYLRHYKARGKWLTLQIREKHARRHAAVSFSRLSAGLRKVRCRMALDGFGADRETQTPLGDLRFEYARFPLELARGLADDRSKQSRLRELTKLCREAGVQTLVPGVEDSRALTVLWTAGIDYVQGNLLQGPSPEIDHGEPV